MSKDSIVRYRRGEPRPPSQTDWARFDGTTDEEIARQVAQDPDAAPLIDESWLATARIVEPDPKVPVTIRLDREVVEFFKDGGPGYQTRINAVLRSFMEHQRKAG
ncbi:MAG: hypothetical protein RLY86_2882 [Pseudomonadota bacterium]